MARAKLPVVQVDGCGVCAFLTDTNECEAWMWLPTNLADDYMNIKPQLKTVPDQCPMRHFDMSFEFPEAE